MQTGCGNWDWLLKASGCITRFDGVIIFQLSDKIKKKLSTEQNFMQAELLNCTSFVDRVSGVPRTSASGWLTAQQHIHGAQRRSRFLTQYPTSAIWSHSRPTLGFIMLNISEIFQVPQNFYKVEPRTHLTRGSSTSSISFSISINSTLKYITP